MKRLAAEKEAWQTAPAQRHGPISSCRLRAGCACKLSTPRTHARPPTHAAEHLVVCSLVSALTSDTPARLPKTEFERQHVHQHPSSLPRDHHRVCCQRSSQRPPLAILRAVCCPACACLSNPSPLHPTPLARAGELSSFALRQLTAVIYGACYHWSTG